MSIAFIFAGQGTQAVGMGKDVYEKNEVAKKIYDSFPGVRDLAFDGPKEMLEQTSYAQPTILLTSYVLAKMLEAKGIVPKYTCGLSLGEYSALAFNNVWPIKEALEIISYRGNIMQNALPIGTSMMAAVIGLDREIIKTVISKVNGICEVANYNCPGQIVITGAKEAVTKASLLLVEAGARKVIPLNVSGAFHSSLLNVASKQLREKLNEFEYNNPKYQMVYNLTGKEENGNIYDLLEKQICNSVYFEDSIRYMIDNGVDTFIEIGPGKALSAFVKKINQDVKIINVSSIEGYNELVGGIS